MEWWSGEVQCGRDGPLSWRSWRLNRKRDPGEGMEWRRPEHLGQANMERRRRRMNQLQAWSLLGVAMLTSAAMAAGLPSAADTRDEALALLKNRCVRCHG